MTNRTVPGISPFAAIVVVLLLAGVHQVVAQEPDTSEAAKPKAVVAEPVHDAGVVPTGGEVVHDFLIENQGRAPLEITDVRPACGCTVAQFDRVIAPGASGKVHAVLDTSTFSGPIAKGIAVLTNDAASPRLDLTVKADVQPHLNVDPGYARFLQPQHSDPGVVEQRLWTQSFDDLEILDVRSPYPFLSVDHTLIEEEADRHEQGLGPQHQLTFVFDYATAPVGALAEYVVIETNHPTQREVKIPVSGFVRPLVVITPSTAEFGEITLTEDGASGSLLLKHYGSTPLAISDARTDVPGVEVAVEPLTEGSEFRVQVLFGPDMPKGEFNGTIRLSTNNPRKPTVEIPLSGVVG